MGVARLPVVGSERIWICICCTVDHGGRGGLEAAGWEAGHAGRDHWPDCYSITMAGGGVKGGYVHGASDNIGAYPIEKAVTPGDLAATIYWRFGVNPNTEIHDQTGRPHRLAEGRPIYELFNS